MEAVLTENSAAVTAAHKEAQSPDWKSALERVEAYLRAWRVGDPRWSRECAKEIVAAAQNLGEGNPIPTAIEEADRFLQRWFQQFGVTSFEPTGEVSIEQRLALLAGASRETNLSDRTQLGACLRQGALNSSRATMPSRPPETRAMRMQSSLSRLPSIQIIGGWLLLVALLFLAFVLTHHRLLP